MPGLGTRGRRRWRRLLLFVALGVPTVAGAAAATVAVLWPLTPSVADAGQRIVARLDSHHGSRLLTLPHPDRVGQAVIATENSRFRHDYGLDPFGVVRATVGSVTGSRDAGGATLEQQLAKILYTPGSTGPAAKVEQVELAFKLDHRYSKDRVLQMYLSAVYFGHGYYGLPAAARGYFGVVPSRLTWAQASLLAGLVQAPTAYDPYLHPVLAKHRQRHVLDRLVATHVLSRAAADAAGTSPWNLVR